MKHLNTFLLMLASLIISLVSCKKDNTIATAPLVSINVTNVVVGGGTLTLNTSILTVANNNYAQFTLNTGQSFVDLHSTASPATPYFNQTFPTNNGDNYSLFLGGTSPNAVDAILVKESYHNYTDSLAGVRFVNMSPNSPAVNVVITTLPAVNQFSNIAYKQVTDFKTFPALAANTSYIFQVRNATTNALISSITLSGTSQSTFVPRFHNITLVLRGLVGGSPAAGLTRVNNY